MPDVVTPCSRSLLDIGLADMMPTLYIGGYPPMGYIGGRLYLNLSVLMTMLAWSSAVDACSRPLGTLFFAGVLSFDHLPRRELYRGSRNTARRTTRRGWGMGMTGSDYDAPRRSTLEQENAEIESLDAVRMAKAQAQSPVVDLEEVDAGESVELPDADLAGEELTMPVVPKKADEFTCSACFLVQHSSRVGSGTGGARLVCIDCS